ncbi:Secondary thiamine-phosphate synthase enzyme [Citrus sinensis]|uniref:Secondary thiamine-phosphate synthase enzyme n=1 Tax=Citrus sinensis TaxID=2711 RepID=A0ACB8L056_CITSI|nr:Secondary thiamine-phosphate synthase enzyme [Citrus sinensis]
MQLQLRSSSSASALFSAVQVKPPSSPPVRVKALFTKNPGSGTLKNSNSNTNPNPNPMASNPRWAQKTVTLPPLRRGCHLITPKIVKEIAQDLSEFKCGLAHLFLLHTSASLTINENYDSDVRDDTETFLNKIVPEGRSASWKHTLEGPDDMPAHIKSSMFGCTLTPYLLQDSNHRWAAKHGNLAEAPDKWQRWVDKSPRGYPSGTPDKY